MRNKLDAGFWKERYKQGKTGWDIGQISTPLKTYIDQLTNKELKILIPGAGNSWEAEYLFEKGFRNTFVVDLVNEPLENFSKRYSKFPQEQILHTDFFEIEDYFDLILEQTFFCALPIKKRPAYARKCHDLLKDNGKVAGVLFNFKLTENGPPFGGNKNEYLTYFSEYFKIEILEPCYNSIKPRQGNELFFKFKKL
ncbi:MAG TPA: methyltransferase domain-containing protein [Salegentibacter sp.]|uniref:methyltransferase domain-containing protein n=1 Tax=Salegentibacter sp. TaxID=1903072 RepID=UPI002F93CC16